MEIKVKCLSGLPLPSYQTTGSAGMDLCACLSEALILKPNQRVLVPTGLFFEIPMGYEVQIRPRSGLALKHGITVLNSPGTIDADYRGEVKVLLINLGEADFSIAHGDRIAQMILSKHEVVSWHIVENLNETDRGAGGYGSTGK